MNFVSSQVSVSYLLWPSHPQDACAVLLFLHPFHLQKYVNLRCFYASLSSLQSKLVSYYAPHLVQIVTIAYLIPFVVKSIAEDTIIKLAVNIVLSCNLLHFSGVLIISDHLLSLAIPLQLYYGYCLNRGYSYMECSSYAAMLES